ncbi:MAG: aminodeoxychorismate/anthranilate synthase component II [Spirochaetia bacterium]|nr:aminodeoxychorismate/anthranilate synthase component II [Spirochaetia bacterium]
MILLIDNYDSFSYNLYQLIGSALSARDILPGGSIDTDIKVIRNDEMPPADIEKLSPAKIVISPGPGKPSQAGVCIDVIKALGHKIPILGVCLGHQAIFEAYGGTVSYAKKLMHGKTSDAAIDTDDPLFQGLPRVIKVARYHSLAGLKETLPAQLRVSAQTEDGEIMAVSHKEYNVYGVQFHPESILTPDGFAIIRNFLAARQ